MSRKLSFNLFLYISLAFLVWALYRANFLTIPTIRSVSWLLLSLVALWVGFVLTSVVWLQFFRANGFPVRFVDCLSATGLSVFGKYIPGKIWILLGVAGFIAQKYGYPLKRLTLMTLSWQLSQLWTGLIVGTIGLFLIDGLHLWGGLISLLLIGLTLAIFSQKANQVAASLARVILRQSISIPILDFWATLRLMPVFFLSWLLWSFGFYAMIRSLFAFNVPLATGCGFALSATLGIMAIVAPGGLGVREGLLVAFLVQAGLSLEQSTTISVTSRLWFFLGELFIFGVGLISHFLTTRHLKKGLS